tara:strand:+ start:151 stop:654 length:504 start_codon:yes stop_codon:yes gene_type:complete
MKKKIKIVYSNYYYKDLIKPMIDFVEKNKEFVFDKVGVAGSFEIPYEIARSIKEDVISNKEITSSFKEKGKENVRDNIVQMAKLSQLNLSNQCIYSGYLALGCIIKGKTINHLAISNAIFLNLQRISIENIIPIGNGIFNANNKKEALEKNLKCTDQAINALSNLLK